MPNPLNDADEYLLDVRSRLNTLDTAPDPDGPDAADAITARVLHQKPCDRCRVVAQVAYITRTEPPRWLDLCAIHAYWLTTQPGSITVYADEKTIDLMDED